MKASELRIGNLVYRTNKLTKEKLIIELTASCILDIHANGEMSGFIYEPIPLTEEWLLVFGFEKGSDVMGDCFYIESEKQEDFSISLLGNGFYIHGIELSIVSVHQLQNLYFALTNEELTVK